MSQGSNGPKQGVTTDVGVKNTGVSTDKGHAPQQGVSPDCGTIDKGVGTSGGKNGPSQGVQPNLQP